MTFKLEALTNVSKLNPYSGWDRGLFIVERNGLKRSAKIVDCTHITYDAGGMGGILSYSIRVYANLVTTKDQLLGMSHTTEGPYNCLTANMLGEAILAEAYAIRQYKRGILTHSPETLAEIREQGKRLITASSNGLVTDIETVTQFQLDVNGVLQQQPSEITFTAVNNGSTIRDTFTTQGKPNPLSDVLKYIRSKATPPV